MSKLKVLICEVDSHDENKMKEIASFDVEETDIGTLERATTLDELESKTDKLGQQIKKKLLQVEWKTLDKKLSDEYRQLFPP
jgi:NADH/NAD ratio-sensing transcriptional regulator Rex